MEVELVNAINTVWVAICAALIFQMEGGFALLEAGFIRGKNAVSIIAKVIMDIIFGGLAFYAIGFGIAYGKSNGWFGVGFGIVDSGLDLTIPDTLFWFLQFGFAVAAVSIVSGAVTERIKTWAYATFVVIFVAFVYPLSAGWVWNANGWLAKLGFNDFAGSAAVHAVGGWAACAGAIVLGPRIGKYNKDGSSNAIPGHNLPMASIGAFILWFGWFGFNPGSSLAAVGNWELIGRVIVNTFLASAAGGVATMFYTALRYKKIDISMTINGVLAGLVAVTAGCNVVTPIFAIIIGLIAGVLVDIAVAVIDNLKIDDPVGAVAVHGVNGLWGTFAVGLFAVEKGLLVSGQTGFFFVQLIGGLSCAVFSFVISYLIFITMKKTVGLRVSKNEELAGVDLVTYGVEAYSTFE